MLRPIAMDEQAITMVNNIFCNALCCKCQFPMRPNAANMCVNCLSLEIDITEGLLKHLHIVHCPRCDKYLQHPKTWVAPQLESNGLLIFCMNKLRKNHDDNNVNCVHAEFDWTEPNWTEPDWTEPDWTEPNWTEPDWTEPPRCGSIKVLVKIQKEVLNEVILEKYYVVEFVQLDHICESCSGVQASPDQWIAAVQVRQHVSHRHTFFHLEQLILRHGAAARALRVKQIDQGIDFFFSNISHGVKFVEFVDKVVPTRCCHDKQLVSQSNNYNYKYTFSVEISPICREDLICLPPRVAFDLGDFGPLVICTKVTNSIALLDPFTLKHCFVNADQYWRASFKSLLTSTQLVEYIVLDVKIVSSEVYAGGTKYVLADAQVARVSDFGKNDRIFSIRTHLGHLLNTGDYALGYDLYGVNFNNMDLDKYRRLVLPDAILIKKSYEEKRQRNRGKPRAWKLKSLDMEIHDKGKLDQEKMNAEYEQFLKDLEENPDLRFNISLYRNREYQPSERLSVTDGEDMPSVPLEELLADLDLNEHEEDVEDCSME